jgi:hypothetical protein
MMSAQAEVAGGPDVARGVIDKQAVSWARSAGSRLVALLSSATRRTRRCCRISSSTAGFTRPHGADHSWTACRPAGPCRPASAAAMPDRHSSSVIRPVTAAVSGPAANASRSMQPGGSPCRCSAALATAGSQSRTTPSRSMMSTSATRQCGTSPWVL